MTKHYSYEDWCQYVKNEKGENNREEMETHLYSCDQCLELYLQVLAVEDSRLPVINNENEFTAGIMVGIADLKKQTSNQANMKKSFYQSSVFHYLLAAAMTIVLMGSGVFQSIAKYADTVQSPIGKAPSFSEGLIHKTFKWMDSIEQKNKEVKK